MRHPYAEVKQYGSDMADQDFPTKDLSNAERISPTVRIGEDNKALPSAQPFSSLMKGETPLANTGKTPMISPFDLMQSGHSPIMQTATTDTLLNQVKHAHSTLGDISNQLNTPKLKLRSSDKYLLKNKLNNTIANLRAVNAKLGTDEEKPEEEAPSTKMQGPLGRFMSYLADGQKQLVSAQQQLQSLKAKGDSLATADFLLIQIKLNKAQQELDFTSVLLSNAVSGFKTLMQVQL
ncbi:MAG: hypothetical protein ACRDDW_02315 [Candidatus Rhabdochlamydia sp.]